MKQALHILEVRTGGKSLVPITDPVCAWVAQSGIASGLLTLWCRHTSASLTVQERVSPAVLRDIAAYFDRLAPEAADYEHAEEGPDDMPAHLRTMLTGVNLTLPVQDRRPLLGTWQGLFLFEHRRTPHHREIALHLLGD